MIRTKKVGLTSLKITAQCPWAQDSIHERLRVEADGVTKYVNKAILVKVTDRNRRSLGEPEKYITVERPPNAVPGSEHSVISVGGDMQASTLTNIEDLVRLPHGCGEQNMIDFVPNILVLRYLEGTNRRDPAIEQKAKGFLATGYQTELTYKHSDGSYSTWGPTKYYSRSSTWLTAYVIRSFLMAKKYTYIDPSVLREGLSFLASKQNGNGRFLLNGVYYSAMKNSLAFSSYVLLTFLENKVRLWSQYAWGVPVLALCRHTYRVFYGNDKTLLNCLPSRSTYGNTSAWSKKEFGMWPAMWTIAMISSPWLLPPWL